MTTHEIVETSVLYYYQLPYNTNDNKANFNTSKHLLKRNEDGQ